MAQQIAKGAQIKKWFRQHMLLSTVVILYLLFALVPVLFGRTSLLIAPSYITQPGVPYDYEHSLVESPVTYDPAGSLNVSYGFDLLTNDLLKKGELPLWNAWMGIGSPLAENGISAVFTPLQIFNHFALPYNVDVIWVVQWCFAGLFIGMIVRYWKRSDLASSLAAGMFLFSGTMILYAPLREYMNTIVWTVFLLFLIERWFVKPEWKWRHVWIAVGVAGVVVAGQPETMFMSVFFFAAYTTIRVIATQKIRAALFGLVPGVIAGGLLTTPYWYGFLSYGLHAFSNHPANSEFGMHAVPVLAGASLFFPWIFGALGGVFAFYEAGWVHPLLLIFCGIALPFLPRIARKQKWLLVLWLIIFVLMILKILGVQPVQSIGHLPFFERLNIPRYGHYLFVIASALIVGLLTDTVIDAKKWTTFSRKHRRNIHVIALSCMGVMTIAAVMILQYTLPVFTIEGVSVQIPTLLLSAHLFWLSILTLILYLVYIERVHPATILLLLGAYWNVFVLRGVESTIVPYIHALSLGAVLIVCIIQYIVQSGIVSIAIKRIVPLQYTAVLVGAMVMIVGTIMIEHQLNINVRSEFLRPTPVISYLQEHTRTIDRMYSLSASPQPNFAPVFGLASVNIIEAVLPQQSAWFMANYLDTGVSPLWFAGETSAGRVPGKTALSEYVRNKAYYDLIGTRYITTSEKMVIDAPNIQKKFSDTTSTVWESTTAFPRVLFVSLTKEEYAKISEFGLSLDTPEALSAFLEKKRAQEKVIAPTTLDWKGDGFDAVFAVQETPGIFITMDTMMEGWFAEVNKENRNVDTIGGVFRGVLVDAPQSKNINNTTQFSMEYRPHTFVLGGIATALGLLLLVCIQEKESRVLRRLVKKIKK